LYGEFNGRKSYYSGKKIPRFLLQKMFKKQGFI